VAPRLGTWERGEYATVLAELWGALTTTLSRLDEVAGEPDGDGILLLPALQYRLHEAHELLAGVTPPEGAEEAHVELLAALEDARDLTGEVVEWGLLSGPVHQWRAALFRVRLARSQLLLPQALPAPRRADPDPESTPFVLPLAALTLTLLGTVALVVGAMLGPWPVWAIGIALVGAAILLYRS
jgi:hypothetical protein